MIGGFYGTYISRSKINRSINQRLESLPTSEFIEFTPSSGAEHNRSTLIVFLNMLKTNFDHPIMLDKILGDYEIVANKTLGQSKLLVKMGPMLGLMGTLTPTGPALVGLATGDISSMASNMQVAFTTTVVGIIIGAIGFITLQVGQRW